MPDSDRIAESSTRSRAKDKSTDGSTVQSEVEPIVETKTQLGHCERLVDELLKPNPDETIILPLMTALEIPRSPIAVDRIAQVFEKLEWLAKNQNIRRRLQQNNRPEKGSHDLSKYS